MASPGDVSIFPVFVIVLCVYHCTVCTVLVPFVQVCVCHFFPFMLDINVQCSGMASLGDVSIFLVFVLVLCVYHCTVCTMFVSFVPRVCV